MTTQHTPTPWKVDLGSLQRTDGTISIVEDKPGVTYSSPVVTVPIYEHDGTATATATFIVQACNSHDSLLAAAEANIVLFELWRDGIFKMMEITWIEEPPAIQATRAAIKRAREDGT